MKNDTNWAGNHKYQAKNYFEPRSPDEISQIVQNAARVKAVGTRHCFNDIADTGGTHISLRHMNRLLSVDEKTMNCVIEGGAQYIDFCSQLETKGVALHNLASLSNISVAGACATATHGSGINNGSLATAVKEIEFVSGTGQIGCLNENETPDKFYGAIVNLGALGIVTKLMLRLEKSYQIRQDLFENLQFEEFAGNFEAIMASGYSVSLYTSWENKNIRVLWIKRKVEKNTADFPKDFYGAAAATATINSNGLRDEKRSRQLGAAWPWHENLPHFRAEHQPRNGDELQSEYYVKKELTVEAFSALFTIADQINPLVNSTEIRSIASDNHWLSPFYQKDSVGFHFTWKKDQKNVLKLLPLIENVLAPFNPIPHWGKLFTTSPDNIRSLYKQMPAFINVMQEFDPAGKFRNDFLNRYFENV